MMMITEKEIITALNLYTGLKYLFNKSGHIQYIYGCRPERGYICRWPSEATVLTGCIMHKWECRALWQALIEPLALWLIQLLLTGYVSYLTRSAHHTLFRYAGSRVSTQLPSAQQRSTFLHFCADVTAPPDPALFQYLRIYFCAELYTDMRKDIYSKSLEYHFVLLVYPGNTDFLLKC